MRIAESEMEDRKILQFCDQSSQALAETKCWRDDRMTSWHSVPYLTLLRDERGRIDVLKYSTRPV